MVGCLRNCWAAATTLGRSSGSVTLSVVPGRVRRLFEIANLTGAFDMCMSVLDAIASGARWEAAIGRSPQDWCREQELA